MALEHSAYGMILSGEGGGFTIQSSYLLFCNSLLSVDADAVRILMAVIRSVTVDCSMHAYRYMSLHDRCAGEVAVNSRRKCRFDGKRANG